MELHQDPKRKAWCLEDRRVQTGKRDKRLNTWAIMERRGVGAEQGRGGE